MGEFVPTIADTTVVLTSLMPVDEKSYPLSNVSGIQYLFTATGTLCCSITTLIIMDLVKCSSTLCTVYCTLVFLNRMSGEVTDSLDFGITKIGLNKKYNPAVPNQNLDIIVKQIHRINTPLTDFYIKK
jgi:hypothetical protein